MAITATNVLTDVTNILAEGGDRLRFRYFNVAYPGGGSYYDDTYTLAQSGADIWTSGLIMPIHGLKGSTDAILLEQGKVLQSDTKIYVLGTVSTSGTYRVGLGSPIRNEYAPISEGIQGWQVNGSNVIKEVYLRVLSNGSILGE